jgi:hypothetical protein
MTLENAWLKTIPRISPNTIIFNIMIFLNILVLPEHTKVLIFLGLNPKICRPGAEFLTNKVSGFSVQVSRVSKQMTEDSLRPATFSLSVLLSYTRPELMSKAR